MPLREQTSFEVEHARELLHKLQDFLQTIREEWSRVKNQWSNLEQTWRDEQYEKFEPLFDQLSSTYSNAEQECEGYIRFVDEQIRIAEKRKQRLSSLDNL